LVDNPICGGPAEPSAPGKLFIFKSWRNIFQDE
jgi:hypothetical protein